MYEDYPVNAHSTKPTVSLIGVKKDRLLRKSCRMGDVALSVGTANKALFANMFAESE